MNLGQIEADLYEAFGVGSAPDPDTVARFRRYVNMGYREVLSMKHFLKLRRVLLTVDSIANTPFMALPASTVKIFGISDRTNDYQLEEKDLTYLRRIDPALRAQANYPWAYAMYNRASPVVRDPSAAAQLFVKSTHAEDVNTAYLESIITGGYHQSNTVTMTGVTALGFTPTTSIKVIKFYLSRPAVGTVTLTEGSGVGTELARIPVGKQFARYLLVHLYPVPTAVSTYYADIEFHVDDLTNAGDEPIFDEEFHQLLVDYAKSKEWGKREKLALKKDYYADYRRQVSEMIHWVNSPGGPDVNAMSRRHSSLGPFFEPGT